MFVTTGGYLQQRSSACLLCLQLCVHVCLVCGSCGLCCTVNHAYCARVSIATTAHPESFGDVTPSGGFKFGATADGQAKLVVLQASGFEGSGCRKAAWTMAAASNQGTFDMADAKAGTARLSVFNVQWLVMVRTPHSLVHVQC